MNQTATEASGFASDSSYNAKRDREESLKDDELESSLLTIECLPPAKKFAGAIRFPVTQDLNFEQFGADLITNSRDSSQENSSERFPECPGALIKELPQMKAKETSRHLEATFHSKQDTRSKKDLKLNDFVANACETSLDLNTESDKSYGKKDPSLNLKISDPPSNVSAKGVNMHFPATPNPVSNSSNRCEPNFITLPQKERTSKLVLQQTQAVAENSKQQDLSYQDNSNLASSHKTLKTSESSIIPTQNRGAKLPVIDENEILEHRVMPNVDSNICVENSLAGHKRRINVASIQESGKPATKGPVLPYENMQIVDNAILDAESEICVQWLNKDRSNTLEQLQDRLDKAKSKESKLCHELERMLVQTKEILDSELEFSVKLCSIRGQCLLFQETTRSDGADHFQIKP